MASEKEREQLRIWAARIIEIYESKDSKFNKLKLAITFTYSSKSITPFLKIAIDYARRHIWSNRSMMTKFGMSGAAIGIVIFGWQGAGIAAFGTAIGVPIFFLTGVGAVFAGILWQELTGQEKS
ncbi:hypothetical protein [Xanthobacter autotrophicus]|uniref:hypothetical protein n=1 Tax=Xanthobacter autotrophicus TaxID=280 RepID=UPI00372C2D0B